jgi:FkbM family methyltransferase
MSVRGKSPMNDVTEVGLKTCGVVDRLSGTIVSAQISDRGVQFFVADENDIIQKEHWAGKFYEANELEVISQYFPSGGVFADIGSNVGNHMLFVALFLSPCEVIVVEPNLHAFGILKANVALNQLGSCVDVSFGGIGLSNTSAHATAITKAGNLGETRLQINKSGVGLPVVAGDELLSGRRIDFLKIDVEGMEIDVLNGLRQTIEEQKPFIFVEVDNSNAEAFLEWSRDNNYVCVYSTGRPVWSVPPASREGYDNFMLVPESQD